MKILRVHNHYRTSAPSGENILFRTEGELLRENGIQFSNFEEHSDNHSIDSMWSKVRAASTVVWSQKSKSRLQDAITEYAPDIIHIHNTFPFISPSILWHGNKRIPTVMTLHNYRPICPKAIPLRAGKVCVECIDNKNTYSAIKHACYRNSVAATLPVATKVQLHRMIDSWRNIDAYIFLTEFQRKLYCKSDMTIRKSLVKPNPNTYEPEAYLDYKERAGVCFVGRISEEKGIIDVVQAWIKKGDEAPVLTIAGDGPLTRKLTELVSSNHRIKFLGQVSQAAARELIGSSRLCILPSKWFEGFPMVLSDAIACRTPAIVSNIGSLKEIADCIGLPTFELSDEHGLIKTVDKLYQNYAHLSELGASMRDYYNQYLEPKNNTAALLELYESLLTSD